MTAEAWDQQEAKLVQSLIGRTTALPAWQPTYDAFVARLQENGVGSTAPKAGERFADFALPDVRGRYHRLGDLLELGPLLLSFNRGAWCPYCRHELESWSASLPLLAELNCGFAAISGEVGGRAEVLASIFTDPMTMLCDIDHGVALELGLAFYVGEGVTQQYLDAGLDLVSIYGSASGLLPVPATFLLDTDGQVLFSSADPDFRRRADPADIIKVLRAL